MPYSVRAETPLPISPSPSGSAGLYPEPSPIGRNSNPGQCPRGVLQARPGGAYQLMHPVLEPALNMRVPWLGPIALEPRVLDVIRAAELEADEMIDLVFRWSNGPGPSSLGRWQAPIEPGLVRKIGLQPREIDFGLSMSPLSLLSAKRARIATPAFPSDLASCLH